ncbi:MAG: terpene cyclase/mutase family protein [Acidobacteria bacterium]|nr:terpene cyclase/mutase family protein [Acidobacteriota bacterium]
MLRREFLLGAAGFGRARRPYFERMQGADGGWHSSTYGLLRSGQSLTGFVLSALPASTPPGVAAKGIAFLRRHTDSGGAVGRANPLLYDYPVYATALALLAEVRWQRDGWREQVRRHAAYLRTQQFTEESGWQEADAPFGAWGMGGDRRTPPHAGHVDLSMSRHAVEALTAAGESASGPVLTRARVFLSRLQNSDGGFHFSTVVADANKAGGTRSYGSATADGLLALASSGAAKDRINAAASWLRRHHRPDSAPGFEGPAYARWPQGLRYYYAAASARAFAKAGMAADPDQARLIAIGRRGDGSWINPEPLVKEDDPLIATGFALLAQDAS